MLWHNKKRLTQVFYDSQGEPVFVKPYFALNDLDLMGASFPVSFEPVGSIYEILNNKPDARICLVRESSIGDILLMLPVFYRIKELYTLCQIFFATVDRYMPLFKYVDFIEPVKKQKIEFEAYDIGYDFNLSLERAERAGWGKNYHRSNIYARLLGLDLKEYRFDLPISGEEKKVAREILHANGYKEGPLVGFQIRGAETYRSIPIQKVKNVVNRLAQEGIQVALLDGDRNIGWEGENIINTCGMLDLLGLLGVVDSCDLVVSTDSGITHIAGALGKKNVAFFACVPAENRVKYPNCKVVDLARAYGCEPCWESGDKCGRRWSCLAEADENLIFNGIMSGFTDEQNGESFNLSIR